MKKKPLVSVGIPTFDRPDGLKRTLDCIAGQTYENLEIIVSDNCSNNTDVQRVLQTFQQNDNRVKYFIQPENKGAAYNFQFVLDQATGDYFMWAADDDWWDVRFVEKAVVALEENPSAVACWSNVLFHLEDNTPTWPKPYHLYTNPDLSRDSKITAILKYQFQFGWYGIYALFRRETITKANLRHCKEYNVIFGADVHIITEVLLAGTVLKLHEPFFHYSNREEASAEYHLARQPNFAQSSKENPYLAHLLQLLKIVMSSNTLTAFAKLTYYCRFLLTVLLKNNAWYAAIRRYPCEGFYRTLLREGMVKDIFMLIPIEMAAMGHRVVMKLARGARKLFRIVRLAKDLFWQLGELIRFASSLPSQPRVLIVEPNICHAEFAIGVGQYLKELGYNCHFLVSSEIGRENPFCRMPKGYFAVHCLMYPLIMQVLTSRFLSLYDLAIFSSSFDFRKAALFVENYTFRHKPKSGILFVEHDLQNVAFANSKVYQDFEAKRLLVLTNYRHDENLTEIGPCYFGDIKTQVEKRNPFVVLVPGSNAQDVGSLIWAAKLLIGSGLKDFELHIVGSPANEWARKDAEQMGVQDCVKMLGRVDFPTLYREIEECNFLIGPQDLDFYLNRRTSGSKLLSLGFLKPLIIREELAATWGFDASNCISYSGDEGLVRAIERALLIQDVEYHQMVDSLRVTRTNAEQDSLLRLSRMLSDFTSEFSSEKA